MKRKLVQKGWRVMNILIDTNVILDVLCNRADFVEDSLKVFRLCEAEQITGETDPDKVWQALHARYPQLSLLITLGSRGSVAYRVRGGIVERHAEEAVRVKAVDTTAAGDTYTGYFLAGLIADEPLPVCMNRASRAAAIAVTRSGAAGSIPWKKELDHC